MTDNELSYETITWEADKISNAPDNLLIDRQVGLVFLTKHRQIVYKCSSCHDGYYDGAKDYVEHIMQCINMQHELADETTSNIEEVVEEDFTADEELVEVEVLEKVTELIQDEPDSCHELTSETIFAEKNMVAEKETSQEDTELIENEADDSCHELASDYKVLQIVTNSTNRGENKDLLDSNAMKIMAANPRETDSKQTDCDDSTKQLEYLEMVEDELEEPELNSSFENLTGDIIEDDDFDSNCSEGNYEHTNTKLELQIDNTEGLYEALRRLREFRNASSSKPIKSNKKVKTTTNEPVHCDVCNFVTSNALNLKKHVIRMHTPSSQLYKCDICGATSRNRNNLITHRKRHTHPKRFCCTFCAKMFHSQVELRTHERTHTKERPYECGNCGKRFQTSGHLTEHQKREANVRKFSCTVCDKLFKSKFELKYHQVVHTKERKFACEHCDSKFTMHKALKVHEKLHLNAKEYTCDYCPMAFNQRPALVAHVKNKHKTISTLNKTSAVMQAAIEEDN